MFFLEYFIPQVLSEVHRDWKYESLDGVCPEIAIKTGDREIEIIGTAIVMSDRAMVPIQVVIRVARAEDSIEYMECKLGELAGQSMKRVPYGHKQCYRLSVASRRSQIEWAYHVAFGHP